MAKMWEGVTAANTDVIADDFNSSISFDCKMYKQDIEGSIAHASMLARCGIISVSECEKITEGLGSILDDIASGELKIDLNAEDIHMFVEAELTKRIGDVGKKLHTARSRNDQVALDLRLYLRDEINEMISLLRKLIGAILTQAKNGKSMIMPGYTHLQRAQPITFAHHLLAYGMMFTRDITRLNDCKKRMNFSPLGSCALAGTTYNTDRLYTAERLGFDGITENSIDGVSDRDFCVELLSACSLIMTHLSRFSEEVILWSSWEFKFVQLDDAYTTGSSIMPQKKNPDMAELVRGKTGRVYGDLMGTLTVLKGLPLAYNKDMQEDKESVFDAVETVQKCLEIFAPMIETMKPIPENMYKAAQKGFINATDLADYLVSRGRPFRSAYKTAGQLVARCISEETVLDDLPLSVYNEYDELFDSDLYDAIRLENCVMKRNSLGGCGEESYERQVKYIEAFLG